jgi:hypothetical protein
VIVINIKAIGKVCLVLSIPTITERGSRRVFILKVASVSYKKPLTNRLIRHIYLSNIKNISLTIRFMQMLSSIIYSSRVREWKPFDSRMVITI